jgi:hypothetical protein
MSKKQDCIKMFVDAQDANLDLDKMSEDVGCTRQTAYQARAEIVVTSPGKGNHVGFRYELKQEYRIPPKSNKHTTNNLGTATNSESEILKFIEFCTYRIQSETEVQLAISMLTKRMAHLQILEATLELKAS